LRLNTSGPLTYLIDGTWFTLQAPVSLLLGPTKRWPGGIDETRASSRSRPRCTGGAGRAAWPCRWSGRTP
jgi:hypothetical protein